MHVPVYAPKELDRFAFRDHPSVKVRLGLDLTVEATAEKYFAELPALWSAVLLAGGFAMKPLTETSLDEFLEQLNQNAVTCFLGSREAVRAMRRSDHAGGRIVTVAARPALVPTAGMAAYAASKAVVVSLTHSLSEELAPEGIWVNAVAPSIIDTPNNRKAMPDADHARWPSTGDLAETIVHLASPSNAVARGAVIPVYGRS